MCGAGCCGGSGEGSALSLGRQTCRLSWAGAMGSCSHCSMPCVGAEVLLEHQELPALAVAAIGTALSSWSCSVPHPVVPSV